MKKKTGVSLIAIDKLVDTGNIYLQDSVMIKKKDDINTLNSKILKIYTKILIKFFRNIEFYLRNLLIKKKFQKILIQKEDQTWFDQLE